MTWFSMLCDLHLSTVCILYWAYFITIAVFLMTSPVTTPASPALVIICRRCDTYTELLQVACQMWKMLLRHAWVQAVMTMYSLLPSPAI